MAFEPEAVLVLPHVRIQNANAISSPLTWGFPAPSAFTGFMHALQRRLRTELDIEFGGIGIVCHWFEPQVTEAGYTRTFRLTRNPVDKRGETAAIVEEGRTHLEATLLLATRGGVCAAGETERAETAQHIAHIANDMRIAGGSPLPGNTRREPELTVIPEDYEARERVFRRWCRQCLPGFALIGRDDLLDTHLEELRRNDPDATRIDAWLDLSRLNHYPVKNPDPEASSNDSEQGEKVVWQSQRKPGWIVPIPIGYAALSETHAPGSVASARDDETPFRFVESLFSLGQWISPHRLQTLEELFWYHEADTERGLYLCRNDYADFN